MKKKYKITFDVEVDYPGLNKQLTRVEKDFEKWLKDWAKSNVPSGFLVPSLYKRQIEHSGNAKIKVKIVLDKETILNVKTQRLHNEDGLLINKDGSLSNGYGDWEDLIQWEKA